MDRKLKKLRNKYVMWALVEVMLEKLMMPIAGIASRRVQNARRNYEGYRREVVAQQNRQQTFAMWSSTFEGEV